MHRRIQVYELEISELKKINFETTNCLIEKLKVSYRRNEALAMKVMQKSNNTALDFTEIDKLCSALNKIISKSQERDKVLHAIFAPYAMLPATLQLISEIEKLKSIYNEKK